MTTNAEFVNLSPKRLLGTEDFRDRWFGFMRESIREGMERAFRVGGVYDSAIGLAGDGANKIQLTNLQVVTDGDGHFMDPALAPNSGLQFENAVGITYEVGLHFTTKPDGIQINPRTGFPEYLREVETIGERAEPDAVVDNGNGTITFTVNSVTETGVSNAGRQVMVFRKSPAQGATLPSDAIETRSVVWSGGANKITTSGSLGQASSISTTASDYEVILLGPTIWRNASVSGSGEHAFLGTVTGNGGTPATFNTSTQNVIDFSLSDIGDITTRDPVSGHVKIDVKSFPTDSLKQITVRDNGGNPVFEVDNNGNVTIQGTTTQENVVQVNSSETITDNLTAGDNESTDSHTIKGNWSHKVAASTKFYVDGASGRVGIGGFDSSGYSLNITGKTRVDDNIEPDVNGGAALGTPTKRFSDLYVINLSFSGDFLPAVDNSQDIGSNVRRWAEGHFSQGIAIGDGNNPPAARLHIDTATTPHVTLERAGTSSGAAYNLQIDSNGDWVVNKTSGVNAYYVFDQAGGVDSINPFWRGFHIAGPSITEGATPRNPRIGIYQRSTSLADPTDLEYAIRVENSVSSNIGLLFQTKNEGQFRFVDSAAEQMRIARNWVGIGDTTPDANSYRLRVNRQWTSAVAGNQVVGYFSGNFSAADTGLKQGLGGYATTTHSSGNIDNLIGVSGVAQHQGGGTSTVGNVVGVRAITYDTGATNPTNQIGFWAESPSGSPTNAYGLYVANIAAGTSSNYAIYTNSGLWRLGGGQIDTPTSFTWNIEGSGITEMKLVGQGLQVERGIHAGSSSSGAYYSDLTAAGGIACGFDHNPGSSQIVFGDANCFFQNTGDPFWRVDENVPATNAYLQFDRSAKSWDFITDNGTKLQIQSASIIPSVPFERSYISTWFKNSGETDGGTRPVTDGVRIYGDNSNWHGFGNDALVFEKTDAGQTAPDGAIVFSSWATLSSVDYQFANFVIRGSGECRFPTGRVYFQGTNTYVENNLVNVQANFSLSYNGTDPYLNWDANDYIFYDRSNDWMDFTINSQTECRITANGFEVGNGGLVVGAFLGPTNNAVTINNNGFQLLWDGTDPHLYFDTNDRFWFDRSSNNFYMTGTSSNYGWYFNCNDTTPLMGLTGAVTSGSIGAYGSGDELRLNGDGGVHIYGRSSNSYPSCRIGPLDNDPTGDDDDIYFTSAFNNYDFLAVCTNAYGPFRFRNLGYTPSYDGIQVWCGDDTDPTPTSNVFYFTCRRSDAGGTVEGYIYLNTAGNIIYGNASDERIKTNIAPTQVDGLAVCEAITPSEFNKRDGNVKTDCGLIAQDVEAVFPQAVSEGYEDETLGFAVKTLSNETLVPVLVQAIKQLKALVDAQETRIAALEAA